jgi:hypothetical protein
MIAAVTSAFVTVQALLLVWLELRARRRGEVSILGPRRSRVDAAPSARPRLARLSTMRGGSLESWARRVLITVELIVGLGALYGGLGLLRGAEGFGVKESWLDGGPFPDYRVPAVVLIVVVGGGLLTAAVVTWRRPSLAPLAALGAASILIGWGIVETAVIGYHGLSQIVLLSLFVVGPAALFISLAIRPGRVREHSHWPLDTATTP